MIVAPKTLILAAGAAIFLSACSSADVVSRSPDGIAIAADGEADMEEASRIASRYCEETGRRSILDRTESVGEGAVAYFSCL